MRPHRAWLALLLAAAGCSSEPAEIRRVVVVTVDTLRADRLGSYGSQLELSPALDALAARSLVFDAAYASAPFTFPSIATLFTGRYPAELGVLSNRSAIPESVPTLAALLRERGFATAAVVSNFVLRDKTGLADGFDHYDDELPQTEAVRGWPERDAGDTTDAALAQLAALADAERWFLWVHYQDPHGPYTPPAQLRDRYREVERQAPRGNEQLPRATDTFGRGAIPHYQVLGDEREVAYYRAGYDGEIAVVDAEIGRFVDTLDAEVEHDELLLLFAADHGEALGEHDYWFAHGHHLTDELVRIPMWIRGPGVGEGRRGDTVSLTDVLPTVMARVVQESTPRDYPGRDLLAPGAESDASVPFLDTLAAAAQRRYGVVADGYKLILTLDDGTWQAELFRQGAESIDLAAPAPQVTRRLRTQLEGLRQRYERGTPERRQVFSDDEEQRLRALGYLEEPEP